ncbi:hypothetical protein RJ639_016555 [Escallonia herrerae]|uniref:Reverse transcriptase n=1 Tax=Escallonia herrerae TaxID=1293975 RepID=A0AA88VF95_9ASTE|nr:hypothetical protein RJ639_016555 [Escallonia herrerae]
MGKNPRTRRQGKKDVHGKGLTYVDIKVNGKAIRAMVDTGATHNYISSTEVERAGSTNSVADTLSRRAELDQGALMAMNAIVRADSRVAINIEKKIMNALTKDPVAQQLLKLVESGKTRQFWQEDGLLMTKGRWRDMVEHKKNAGLLQPLPVPKRPWESVSLDFITGLPKVEDLGIILVVVDRFNKYASFITTPKYCLPQDTAQLFFKYVVKYWGMPQDIVSDRDSCFTGNFGTELFKLFGSQLSMSSNYHPESDGQTELFNSMLEEYLCHFKYEGPLTILKKIGKMAYKVDPPYWWSHQLHSVFHVNMLKAFYEETADPSGGQIRRPGLKPKAAGKRVVESILNDRVITTSHKRHQEYLVKWQGYTEEENTWERAADLLAYNDKIEAYHMQKLTRRQQL